jgi:hypothetical protein
MEVINEINPRVEHISGVKNVVADALSRLNLISLDKDENREDVIRSFHCDVRGHFGVVKTYRTMRSKYTWQGMYQDIEKFVRECPTCQKFKHPNRDLRAPMKPIIANKPWEIIGLDIAGVNGANYVMAVDYFSRWVTVIPIRNMETETILKELNRKLFLIMETPSEIVTDAGTQWLSEEFQGFLKSSGVKHRAADPKHQQADGEVEIHIKSFKIQLAMMLQGLNRVQWDDALLMCARNMNQTVCVATQRSPYEVLFGQVPNRVVDNRLREREEKMSDIREKVMEKNDVYKEKQVKEYDRMKSERDIPKGTSVWVRNNKIKWSDPYWVGPYSVVDKNENSYKLESPQKPGRYLTRNIKDIKVNSSREKGMEIESHTVEQQQQVSTPQKSKLSIGTPQKIQPAESQESQTKVDSLQKSIEYGSPKKIGGKLVPKLNQRVSVYWSKPDKYYPGTVKEDLGNGYFGIAYDDEDSSEEPIKEKLIGRGRANWKEEEEKDLMREDEI